VLLVVGMGNELRGDDAAGRAVAERVEALRLPGVEVRSVCQLLPELVDDLARCSGAVFVDADPSCAEVDVRQVVPAGGARPAVTHHLTPAAVLALAAVVGPVPPDAVLVAVPARRFDLGGELSPEAAAGVDAAVEEVTRLVSRKA
jgi:hydrogenase maturation protease